MIHIFIIHIITLKQFTIVLSLSIFIKNRCFQKQEIL